MFSFPQLTRLSAAVFAVTFLSGCGKPEEDDAEAGGDAETVARKAITFVAQTSPSILDQAKATEKIPLPDGWFESDLIGESSAEEMLAAAGLEFPDGTSAKFLRETNELEVKHYPVDLLLAEAVVDSWQREKWEADQIATEEVERTLKSIVLPEVEFSDTKLIDAMAFLESESVRLDEEGQGVKIAFDDFLLKRKAQSKGDDPFGFGRLEGEKDFWEGIETVPITLRLANVPLVEALRYTTSLAQLKYRVTADGVEFVMLGSHGGYLETRAYFLPGDFLDAAGKYDDEVFLQEDDPFAPVETDELRKPTIKDHMENSGIIFVPGYRLEYDASRSLLVFRNAPDQLDLVEAYFQMVLPLSTDVAWKERQAAVVKNHMESVHFPRFAYAGGNFWRLQRVLFESFRANCHSGLIWDRSFSVRFEKPAGYENAGSVDPFINPEDMMKPVEIDLVNPSLGTVLREIARQTNCTVEVNAGGVVLRGNP